jgi:hypothetical protein
MATWINLVGKPHVLILNSVNIRNCCSEHLPHSVNKNKLHQRRNSDEILFSTMTKLMTPIRTSKIQSLCGITWLSYIVSVSGVVAVHATHFEILVSCAKHLRDFQS